MPAPVSTCQLFGRGLELHKHHPNTPHGQEALAREICYTGAHIDRLEYQLYCLTEE